MHSPIPHLWAKSHARPIALYPPATLGSMGAAEVFMPGLHHSSNSPNRKSQILPQKWCAIRAHLLHLYKVTRYLHRTPIAYSRALVPSGQPRNVSALFIALPASAGGQCTKRALPRRPPLPRAVCMFIAYWWPSPPGSGSVACPPRVGRCAWITLPAPPSSPPMHGGCGRLRYAGRYRALVPTFNVATSSRSGHASMHFAH